MQMTTYRSLLCVLPVLDLDRIVLEFHDPYLEVHKSKFGGVLGDLYPAVIGHELRRVLQQPYDSIGLTLAGVFVTHNRHREYVYGFRDGHLHYVHDHFLTSLNQWSLAVGAHYANKNAL